MHNTPKALPDFYSSGDRNEAVIYVAEGGADTWSAIPGAVAWLKAQAK